MEQPAAALVPVASLEPGMAIVGTHRNLLRSELDRGTIRFYGANAVRMSPFVKAADDSGEDKKIAVKLVGKDESVLIRVTWQTYMKDEKALTLGGPEWENFMAERLGSKIEFITFDDGGVTTFHLRVTPPEEGKSVTSMRAPKPKGLKVKKVLKLKKSNGLLKKPKPSFPTSNLSPISSPPNRTTCITSRNTTM